MQSTRAGSLDYAVLDVVLGYMDAPSKCLASEVCRAWRSLSLDPAFWSSFDPLLLLSLPPLSPPPPSSPSQIDLASLLRLPRFLHLHSIDLSPWKDFVTDQWVVDHLCHLSYLRHLSLHNCKLVTFTHPDLSKLSELTSINLGASQMDQQISNASLAILKTLTSLRTVNLHYCEKLNDYGLPHISNPPLPKLQKLDLGNCYRLTSASFATLSSLAPTLTWLSLKSPIRSNTSVKDDALTHLTKFSRLTYLDIGWCTRIVIMINTFFFLILVFFLFLYTF